MISKEYIARQKESRERNILIVFIIVLAYVLLFNTAGYAFFTISSVLFVASIFSHVYGFLAWGTFLTYCASSNTALLGYFDTGRWLFLGLLCIRIILPFDKKGGSFKLAPIHSGITIFIILLVVSSAYAGDLFETSMKRAISIILSFFAMFVSMWRIMDKREKAEKLIFILVYSSSSFIILSLILYYFLGDKAMLHYGRFRGLYANPNTLGLMLTVQIPLAYWVKITPKFNKGKFALLNNVLLYSCIFALFLCGSRSSLMGVVIGGSVFVALRYKIRSVAYGAILGSLALTFYGALVDISETKYFQDVLYRGETVDTFSGRMELWEDSIALSKSRPFLGYGFGTSEMVLGKYHYEKKGLTMGKWGIQTHNSLIRMLLDLGWVGLFWSLIFVISIVRKLVYLLSRSPSKELYMMTLAMTASITAAMIVALFESWLLSAGNVLSLSYWFIVMLVYRFALEPERFVSEGDTPRGTGSSFF